MMKRFCAMLLVLALALSMFITAFAEGETEETVTEAPAATSEELTPEGAGGLDFYSITVHYENPILVDYQYESKMYVFVNTDGEKTMSDMYVYRAGTNKDTDYYGAEKSSKSASFNFYQLQSTDPVIPALGHYSKIPYKYAYITHIQDGAVLKSKDSVYLYGITDPYDEGEAYVNQNPNVNYGSDGYALDKNVDEDGNHYRIDINNYRITKDYLWLDTSGRRIELFYQKAVYVCTGPNEKGKLKYDASNIKFLDEYEFIPYSMRFDENGKVKDISDIKFYQYVSKEEIESFIETEGANATPENPAIYAFHIADTPELVEEITKTSKSSYKTTKYPSYATPFRVAKEIPGAEIPADATGEAAATPTYSDEEYYNKDTVFTMDNIYRDADGNLVFGTPVMGEPDLNVKIKSISIEIDAVGSQTYTDETQDPQYQNTITVSLNDYEINCNAKKAALDGNYISQETYDGFSSSILATVHSKTTSTAVNFDKTTCADGDNKKPTVVSIDLGLTEEQIAALPAKATFYLNFHIKTHQPDEAFDTSYCQLASKQSSLPTENAIPYIAPTTTLPPTEIIVYEKYIPWNIIIPAAAGGLVVVAGIIIGVVAGKKKKQKNAAE